VVHSKHGTPAQLPGTVATLLAQFLQPLDVIALVVQDTPTLVEGAFGEERPETVEVLSAHTFEVLGRFEVLLDCRDCGSSGGATSSQSTQCERCAGRNACSVSSLQLTLSGGMFVGAFHQFSGLSSIGYRSGESMAPLTDIDKANHLELCSAIAVSPSSDAVAVGWGDGSLRRHHGHCLQEFSETRLQGCRIRQIHFCPNGSDIVALVITFRPERRWRICMIEVATLLVTNDVQIPAKSERRVRPTGLQVVNVDGQCQVFVLVEHQLFVYSTSYITLACADLLDSRAVSLAATSSALAVGCGGGGGEVRLLHATSLNCLAEQRLPTQSSSTGRSEHTVEMLAFIESIGVIVAIPRPSGPPLDDVPLRRLRMQLFFLDRSTLTILRCIERSCLTGLAVTPWQLLGCCSTATAGKATWRTSSLKCSAAIEVERRVVQ